MRAALALFIPLGAFVDLLAFKVYGPRFIANFGRGENRFSLANEPHHFPFLSSCRRAFRRRPPHLPPPPGPVTVLSFGDFIEIVGGSSM